MSNYNTAYDDVFRTMLVDCKELIIPVVGETFHENFTGKEQVILQENEIYLRQQGMEGDKKITDSSFAIITMSGCVKKYHLECQSTPDGSVLIRMYEYDSQIALKESVLIDETLTVNFPQSAILYLRHTKKTPDMLTIVINTPGGSISYKVPALKVKTYDIETIFKRKLYFLIPFYIFIFEENFEAINEDDECLVQLKNTYANIVRHLEELVEVGEITDYIKKTICEMSEKVLEHIAAKYDNIKKEVASIMGGNVLDYEAKRILMQGHVQGQLKAFIDLVQDGVLTITDAAKRAGLSEEEFVKKMEETLTQQQ